MKVFSNTQQHILLLCCSDPSAPSCSEDGSSGGGLLAFTSDCQSAPKGDLSPWLRFAVTGCECRIAYKSHPFVKLVCLLGFHFHRTRRFPVDSFPVAAGKQLTNRLLTARTDTHRTVPPSCWRSSVSNLFPSRPLLRLSIY